MAQSPAYQDCMQSLEAYHIAAMCAAPEGPKGTETREHHHRMLHALRELAGELAARVVAAEEIERTLAQQKQDEDDDAGL